MTSCKDKHKIVVLDGYTENPGDLSWEQIEAFGDVTVYDRTSYDESGLIAERIVKTVWRKSGSDIKPGIAAKTAGHIYTLAVVIVGWVFFRADSIGRNG